MLRISFRTEPFWLDLPHGIRLQVRPPGTAVILAAGTDLVVVGAPNGGDGSGRVLVFERAPGNAFAQKSLTTSTKPLAILQRPKDIGDKFGQSVAVSSDGSLIAVGAPSGGNGAVAVYQRPLGGWQDPAALLPVSTCCPPITSGRCGGEAACRSISWRRAARSALFGA